MLVPFKQVKFFPFEKIFRNSRPELFLVKGVLKIYSKFTGEHPCRSATSIKLKSNFIEITLRHGCSTVNLLHISRTPFPRNNSGCELLNIFASKEKKSSYDQHKYEKLFWLRIGRVKPSVNKVISNIVGSKPSKPWSLSEVQSEVFSITSFF